MYITHTQKDQSYRNIIISFIIYSHYANEKLITHQDFVLQVLT